MRIKENYLKKRITTQITRENAFEDFLLDIVFFALRAAFPWIMEDDCIRDESKHIARTTRTRIAYFIESSSRKHV